MKKVLIRVGIVGLILVGLAAAGFWKYFNATGPTGPSPDETKDAIAEGKDFGDGRHEEQCVVESLSRLDCKEAERGCRGKLTFFLSGCLSAAEKTEGFCSSVPPVDAAKKETAAYLEWASSTCEDAGRGKDNPVCHDHLKHVTDHCSSSAR